MAENKNSEESIISPHHSKKKVLIWQLISGILFVALIIAILLAVTSKPTGTNSPMTGNIGLVNSNTTTKVNQKVVDETVSFLKEAFQIPEIVVKDTKVVDGLYEINISIEDQEMPIYTTPTGDNIIIQGMGMINKAEYLKQMEDTKAQAEEQAKVEANIAKSDKPKVEVFVMSHCPYGTQMEKGLIPVIETLKDKADIQIKFVDYAMHGKTEVDEQLNQYCINKEEPEKYLPYLKCFLEAGKGSECLVTAKIDTAKLTACVSSTDTEFKVTELFNDKSTWNGGTYPQFNIYKAENELYGVQGSPTTVINGVLVNNMPRDSKGILDKVCSVFNTAPEECKTELSSTSPSSGFGWGAAGSTTTASCS
jgi:hypothetical protein